MVVGRINGVFFIRKRMQILPGRKIVGIITRCRINAAVVKQRFTVNAIRRIQ